MTLTTPTAEQFATALKATANRYCDGFTARSTFSRQMKALWNQVHAAGLTEQVMRLIDPMNVQGAR